MIKASGATLRIKKIRQSRNGAFCVADLSTDFGEFKVKDTVLDQFEEGEYQATVWISEIFLAQYISYGKAITEIRARLHDLQVDSAGELHETRSEPTEPDPIDEEARGPTVAPAAPSLSPTPTVLPKNEAEAKPSTFDALRSKLDNIRGRKQQPASKEAPASASNDDSLRELFGEDIWQQVQGRAPVKLDPTIGRAVLRQQAATMYQVGYAFDPKQQIWNPK